MAAREVRPSRLIASVSLPRLMPTTVGWLAIAIALVVCVAGVNSGANTLFLISGVVIGALAVSVAGAWRQLTGITVRRSLPASVHAGEGFSVELDLTNHKRRPAHALLLEDLGRSGRRPWRAFTPRVAGSTTTILRYAARVRQRGVVRFEGVRLSTLFPFGLIRASLRVTGGTADELVVYPALGAVRPAFLQGQLGGIRERQSLQPSRLGTTDIHGLREYRAGDSPKHIHWRSTARLGKPVVKEFDREEARRIHVVLDSVLPADADEADREHLEWAISFAATLAAGSTGASRMVGLTAVGPEQIDLPPASGLGQVAGILDHLARLTPAEGDSAPAPEPADGVVNNTAVILMVLTPGRLQRLNVGAWQAPGGSVHVIDVSAPAFGDLFVPPDVLGGPEPDEAGRPADTVLQSVSEPLPEVS